MDRSARRAQAEEFMGSPLKGGTAPVQRWTLTQAPATRSDPGGRFPEAGAEPFQFAPDFRRVVVGVLDGLVQKVLGLGAVPLQIRLPGLDPEKVGIARDQARGLGEKRAGRGRAMEPEQALRLCRQA